MIKIKAKIYLFMHEGRRSSFKTGYRPAFNFDSSNNYYTGHIELIKAKEFKLGEIREVYITFNEILNKNYLKVGSTFSINEPPIVIGEGVILEVLNPQ